MKFLDRLFQGKETKEKELSSEPCPDQPIPESDCKSDCKEESFPIPLVETIERETQSVLGGTKKRFMENHDYNLLLMKSRLATENLIDECFRVGSLSPKKVSLVYLQNKANSGIVREIRERIQDIKTETVLDSSYIERNIENSNLSPFPQLETTQRPDVAESALTQGRVVILVDGSPDALLAPVTFFDLMDTPDDVYLRWFIAANFFRVARYTMFAIAAALPGFYIAITSYYPEMIPTKLLFLILASREGAPFPVYFETFFMMGIAEAVRMMMIRTPSQIGTTVALFSGITLVIAGLSTDIIGGVVVIIVTLTVLSSFGIPNYDLRNSVRIIQFFTMVMSSFLGLFGFAAAFYLIAIHLVTLKSFGIPYMAPLAPVEGSGWGHTIFRDNTKTMAQDETYQPEKIK